MRRVGVLLSGCGVYDGSDVQEAVLVVLALRRRALRVVFMAPDIEPSEVVDHTPAAAADGAAPRRVISESARIARGVVSDLATIVPSEIDAVVVPGGMGVVRNLCLPGRGPLGGGPPRP